MDIDRPLDTRALLDGEWEAAQRLEKRACRLIDAAHAEFEYIERNLDAAFSGRPHDDIGEIRGIDKQTAYSAFGAIRSLEEMERHLFNQRPRPLEDTEHYVGALERRCEALAQDPAFDRDQLNRLRVGVKVARHGRDLGRAEDRRSIEQHGASLGQEGSPSGAVARPDPAAPGSRIEQAALRDAQVLRARLDSPPAVEMEPPPDIGP